MASITLFRAFRGANRLLLLKPQFETSPGLMGVTVTRKSLTLSPALSAYGFKAHRGPYTPAEKQGSGHVMNAATHWSTERVVTVSLLGVLPAALFVQGPVMDFLLVTTIVLHGYWGVHGVLTDYVEKFVPKIHWLWNIISMFALGGLYYFNYNDVGVCKAIQMVWGL